MAKTALQEVKERMQAMKEKKSVDLETIRQKQAEAQEQKEAAEQAIKAATESMNIDAYEEAMQAKNRAEAAINMYAGRLGQIASQEFVSEEESTNVLESLVAYNTELTEAFRIALAEQIKALTELAGKYAACVKDTNQALDEWQRDIRANYFSDTMTRPDGSNRSLHPVPIYVRKCAEAEMLESYLSKAAADFAE